MPSVPEAAVTPSAKGRSYLRSIIAGIKIVPMASAVATLEPQIAANIAQAATQTTPRPPRTLPTQAAATSTNALAIPPRCMKEAAMTKKGTASNVVELSSSSIFWAMPTSGLPSMANIVPAETPSTSQIGRPMPSRTKKMTANSLVMAIRAPSGLPWWTDRKQSKTARAGERSAST